MPVLPFRCLRDGRAGKAAVLMCQAEIRKSVTLAAAPGQVRAARAFVAGAAGGPRPLAEAAELLAREIVSNSVRYSGSAAPGGLLTVTVTVARQGVRVEVTERSGDGSPALRPVPGPDGMAEGGRGLRLVDMLAARWGCQRGGGLATTWFEVAPD
jgi:anti-sigma regulatory factor (Ser/Thr protein kinase)